MPLFPSPVFSSGFFGCPGWKIILSLHHFVVWNPVRFGTKTEFCECPSIATQPLSSRCPRQLSQTVPINALLKVPFAFIRGYRIPVAGELVRRTLHFGTPGG
jgi:hypothetical protein